MSDIRPLFVLVVVWAVSLLAAGAFAQTPDGRTPAEESVCTDAGLTGAAFGLCNAYCEAQDCDVHDRPSCERLRKNFAKHTGTRVFPCDPFCGDGEVNQDFEECDDGNNEDCDGCSANCGEEFCGDGMLCPIEECEPPDSDCDSDNEEGPLVCDEDCRCVPQGPSCDDECSAGGTRDEACSPCIEEVCACDPFCCENSWDAFCVHTAQELCEKDCGSTSRCLAACPCPP